MKKWLLLLTVTLVLTSIFAATTIKVAILPLKRVDSSSKYIQKIMTIRDLDRTFMTNDKFELINLKTTAEVFKDSDIEDIDEMDKEDMAEIGRELNADVVILGVISSINDQNYSIQFRFYSMKTDDLKSQRIDVVKDKKKRWAVLEKDFLGKLSGFINEEMEKMNTLAIQDYHSENYKQAEKGFNQILLYTPDNKQAFYYLGMIAYHNKDFDKAIVNLNKSLPEKITTNEISALQCLSNAYRDKGDKDMMINTLIQIANLQNDEDLWVTIANLYAENKQVLKAKEALLNSLKIEPKYMKAIYRMAFLLYDNGLFDESIPYLEQTANENPDNDLISRRLAFAYQKAGKIDDAIMRYESIIYNNPTNALAYLNVAGLYRTAATDASEKGNQTLVNELNNKAIDVLTRLQKIDGENALVYLRFADVYLATNNLTEAEKNANTALNKDSALYQPYIILATINQRNGSTKYNQFIDLEKKAREAYGKTADRLVKERDTARIAANGLFRRAEEQLKAAKNRTSEPEVLLDVDNKLATLSQLISQTGRAN
ncbi:MAG: tetratricopeptide repeat protein [Candidatus Cloacimonetes bacterium]|nr:tetratricopeptide repeat protein [Candidatus Cloacimonadota bacterium]